MRPIRVLILADDVLAGAGLVAQLSDAPEITVAGPVATNAFPPVDGFAPDVVLWDLGRDARQTVADLDALESMTSPSVVLTSDARHAAQALKRGARACISRGSDQSTLILAVKAAAAGLVVLDPALVPIPAITGDHSREALEELTPREAEVLQLLAEGLPNKVVARRLGISEHTVKFHVDAIFGKLDAHSRTEAVTRAARLGLIIL